MHYTIRIIGPAQLVMWLAASSSLASDTYIWQHASSPFVYIARYSSCAVPTTNLSQPCQSRVISVDSQSGLHNEAVVQPGRVYILRSPLLRSFFLCSVILAWSVRSSSKISFFFHGLVRQSRFLNGKTHSNIRCLRQKPPFFIPARMQSSLRAAHSCAWRATVMAVSIHS